jgi:putative ABC transport system permease protein
METARALAAQDGPNVLRLFLRAGASPRAVEAKLVRASIGAAVIRTDRGEVADRDTHESLSRHRRVAYVVMGTIATLCLLITAHLDAGERRVELATLMAIGASRATILGVLVSRSALVASAGAVAGALVGALLALSQGDASVALLAHGWAVGVATIGSAIVTGVIAAVPAVLAVSLRDPVRELQEG